MGLSHPFSYKKNYQQATSTSSSMHYSLEYQAWVQLKLKGLEDCT